MIRGNVIVVMIYSVRQGKGFIVLIVENGNMDSKQTRMKQAPHNNGLYEQTRLSKNRYEPQVPVESRLIRGRGKTDEQD